MVTLYDAWYWRYSVIHMCNTIFFLSHNKISSSEFYIKQIHLSINVVCFIEAEKNFLLRYQSSKKYSIISACNSVCGQVLRNLNSCSRSSIVSEILSKVHIVCEATSVSNFWMICKYADGHKKNSCCNIVSNLTEKKLVLHRNY